MTECDECGADGVKLKCVCPSPLSDIQKVTAERNAATIAYVRAKQAGLVRPPGVGPEVKLSPPLPSQQSVKCCECSDVHRICDRVRSGNTCWCPKCGYRVYYINE